MNYRNVSKIKRIASIVLTLIFIGSIKPIFAMAVEYYDQYENPSYNYEEYMSDVSDESEYDYNAGYEFYTPDVDYDQEYDNIKEPPDYNYENPDGSPPYDDDETDRAYQPELPLVVPFNDTADIEITAFTSTNQSFTTNDSNLLPLSLQIAYRIVGTGNAEGGEIRIALEDDATTRPDTFFATTIDRINVAPTAIGEQHIDIAAIFVESTSGSNTLVIPFSGGENNITLDTITINIEYNRAWDGQIAPGNQLHTFEAWVVNGGMHSPATVLAVTSHTTDTRYILNVSLVNRTVLLDDGFFGSNSFRIFNNPATGRFWEFEEDTQFTTTMEVPQGATVDPSSSSSIGLPQLINEQLVWTRSTTNFVTHGYMLPRMQFPSTHFSVGQIVPLNITFEYYLRDVLSGNPVPITQTVVIEIILVGGGGIPGGEIIIGWNHPPLITMPANNQSSRDADADNIRIYNQNNLPLENAVITIYNNPGTIGTNTGSKISYRQPWRLINRGSRVVSNWTFYIRNVSGTERVVQVTHNGADVGTTLSLTLSALHGALSIGEYIDRIEIRPQHNGNDALAPGTEFIVRPRFSGFTTAGIDHTGGIVGANSDGFTDINQRVTITHASVAQDFENEVIVRFTNPATSGVDAFVLRAEVRAVGGQIAPGGELPIRIIARANNNAASIFGNNVLWTRPSFLLFIPANASIDTSQTVEAFRNLSGESFGHMTIEFLGIESTGQRVYRLQTLTGIPSLVPTGGENTNDAIRFDLNITTPFGAPAGATTMRVWTIAYAGAGVRHTPYQIGGAVATGLIAASGFFADTSNWTGHNHLAPYLRFTTNNLSYTVATSAGILARARLWNHADNAWQLDGIATVPVGDVGRFQLEIVNSGNQFVGDVRIYNILPNVGTSNTANGEGVVNSQWNASLESLSFRVYDRFNADITNLFAGSQIWVSSEHNSNPSGNYLINRNLINTDFAVMNSTNITSARSFIFDLGTRRLDPGARIVIEGAVGLPATMTAADIGQTAQNSFVTSGQFFNTLTGGTAQGLTPQISGIQTFMASAENNASISGTIFKALAPGIFDGTLEGVIVRLYSGGTAVANFTGLTTTTDEDGIFLFEDLAAGNYYLRFINPIVAATGTSANFNGAGLVADGLNAVTGQITLNASETGYTYTIGNIGLVRTGLVQVQFHRTSDNSIINNTTHTLYSYVNLNNNASGTITPGAINQIALPTRYSISGATYQTFNLTWNIPSTILVFDLTRDRFTVEYNNNKGQGNINSQSADTNTNITLSTGAGFTREGYSFQGWATTPNGTVVYAPEATFTRSAAETITLYAVWQTNTAGWVAQHTVTFSLSGGTYNGNNNLLEQIVDCGTNAAALSKNPTRTGYRFIGWTPDLYLTNVRENRTFVAKWQRISNNDEGNVNNQMPPSDNNNNISGGNESHRRPSSSNNWGGFGRTPTDSYKQYEIHDCETNCTGQEILLALPRLSFTEERIAYVSGFPDGTFRPENSLTRAEIAVMLFRLIDNNNKHLPQPNHFNDVASGSWYAQAINYLTIRNIFSGYPDGLFRPNNPITRAELVATISKFSETNASDVSNFNDVGSSHWAFAFINNAYGRGWISGYADGTFRPNNAITRAEAVTLINRVLHRIPSAQTIDYNLYGVTIFTDVTLAHWAFYEIMEAAIEREYKLDENGLEIWIKIR